MRSELRILGLLLLLGALALSGCGPFAAQLTESPTVAAAPTEAGATPVSSTLTDVAAYELTVAASTPTPSTGVEYCTDWKTATRMSYEEAAEIARKSECVEGGDLKETHMCNEFTGTWWIDLEIEKPGCNPACVVWVVGKTAEINWRCTGVVVPKETVEQPTEVPTAAGTATATPIPATATPPPLGELGKIAFISVREYRAGHPEIYLMDADGSNVRRLSKDDTLIVGYYPALSPDGGRIAYVRAGDVYVVDADGSNPRNLTKYAAGDGEPAWSPDGQQIAFWSNRAGRQAGQAYATDIFVMDADGSNPRNLTDSGFNDTSPTWSPDGRYIAFASDRDGNHEIYVMDADGSNPRRLTNDEANDLWPEWSPDGRYVAFVSDRDGDFEIYVMDADGSSSSHPRNLTNNEEREVGEEGRTIGFDSSPTWSPDGRYIAFQSDREGESQEIWVMEADGSNPRRLTDMRAVQPSWARLRRLEVVKQPVEGWVGTIVKLPHGSQFDGYFERDDGQRYGIAAAEPSVRQQIDEHRWTGAQVRVSGELVINVPAVEARQIQVERIEAISGPTTEARNLALFATPSASSSLPADRGGSYHPWSAIDGLLTSCWAEAVKGSGVGEWVMLTFPGAIEVQRIGLDVGFDKDTTLFAANNRVKRATIRFSTGESIELDFADSRGMQVRDITAVETTLVTVVIDEVYPGSKYDDTSVAEIEVWGVTREG